MTDPFRFHPGVVGDIQNAIDYYGETSAELGNRFRNAVDAAFNHILENPQMHPLAFDDVRFARLRTFPYLVQFRIRDDQLLVLGVFHGASDPSAWKDRAR